MMGPLDGAEVRDVDLFGWKGLLFSRPDFAESFEGEILRTIDNRQENNPAHQTFSTTRSEDEIQLLRDSFYTESLEDPVPAEGEVSLEIASASASTAEWPPTKSTKSPSNLGRVEEKMPNVDIFSFNSQKSRCGGGDSAENSLAHQSAVAVLRHGERQDSVFGSTWHMGADCQRYPFDCPITNDAIVEARHAAGKLSDFADFDVIVSSPYLRCVQTAIALADALDVMVLLDYELGEVFGPAVFGDMDPAGRAWRSRQDLHTALTNWSPQLLQGFSKPPVERVCWQKVLGQPPSWGEKLTDAHHRYATRFLTYLDRGQRAGKNMILVSHGIMVQTCLKVLPGTSALSVASIPFCGGLMARRRISKGSPELPRKAETSPCQEAVGNWPEGSEGRRPASDYLEQAQLHGWDVQTFEVVFDVAADKPAAMAKRYRDFLTRLKAGRFSWVQLQVLLGQLPAELPPQVFQAPELTRPRSSPWRS
ncbi:Icl1f [Symbiodinium natans]|uniref:Icl1f protein n=1 Tax=Symbiodinium natans TaxID=878477 RepID=A0A812KA99_9DINO|nr:Icl1f [Symbiodinium natans]